MTKENFIKEMIPRMGPSVFSNMNTANMDAMIELLIKKGIFTREELNTEFENKLGMVADLVKKMPVPSPFQTPQK